MRRPYSKFTVVKRKLIFKAVSCAGESVVILTLSLHTESMDTFNEKVRFMYTFHPPQDETPLNASLSPKKICFFSPKHSKTQRWISMSFSQGNKPGSPEGNYGCPELAFCLAHQNSMMFQSFMLVYSNVINHPCLMVYTTHFW